MLLPISRLTCLDAVRGFVAVGRRMSITRAAQDLCLTPSAVSRQVATLEEALGVKLLTRGYRSIAFTPEGERFFRAADGAMQQLQDAWGALGGRLERRPVTITASIGVTGLWLLPRLGDLHKKHPAIDVRVAANNKLMDLKAEDVDLAIRYCAPESAPPGAVRLFGERLVPVAHPSLGLGGKSFADVIADQILLEFDDPRRPWMAWTEFVHILGLGGIKPKGLLRFNQYDQLIQAAIGGQGVAMGRRVLVDPLLRNGSLEALPWDDALGESNYAYWLIQAERFPRDDVEHVALWIQKQASTGV